MDAHASRWIPATPDVVLRLVDDATTWPTWLAVADEAHLHTAGRELEVTWHLARSLRGIRTYKAYAGDRVVGTLRLAVSRWWDGSQVEVDVTREDRRTGGWWTRQLLVESLLRLDHRLRRGPRPPSSLGRSTPPLPA